MRRRLACSWIVLACIACVDDGSSEASATIELSTVATLRGLDDSIDLALGRPAISAAGLIAAPLLHQPSGAVGLYDTAGTFIRRVGRTGGGPGEFRHVQSVGFGPGDSLWVVDQMFLAHVFSPGADPQFVRTIRLARPSTGDVTREGLLSRGIVTSGIASSKNGLNAPNLLGWRGERRAEYGALEPPDDMHERMGPLALLDTTRVWLARTRSYELELLGSDGKVHQRLARRVDWFPTDSAPPPIPGTAPPPPRIHAISIDDGGRLWVLVRRGHRDWKPADSQRAQPMTMPIEASRLPTTLFAETFETVLEVLDARTGQAIATRELGGGALGFPAPGLLYEVEQGDLGEVTIRIHRLALVSAPPPSGSRAASPGG
jgi:hypothetical protein